MNSASPEEQARWDEIKKTYKRNQVGRGVDASDSVGRVVAQLASFQSGIEGIQETMQKQFSREQPRITLDLETLRPTLESLRSSLADKIQGSSVPAHSPNNEDSQTSRQLTEALNRLGQNLSQSIEAVHTGATAERLATFTRELRLLQSTMGSLQDVFTQQRNHLRGVEELLSARAKQGTVEFELTQDMLTNQEAFVQRVQQVIAEAQEKPAPGN